MPIDFYLRIPTDPNYDENEIELDVDIQNFQQQLEMILTTRKGDILGDPQFGANLEDYVWSNYSSSQIRSEIQTQIAIYCQDLASKIPCDVDVNFIKGEIYDTILVDLILDGTKVMGIAVTP
jgi:hypothetical protein